MSDLLSREEAGQYERWEQPAVLGSRGGGRQLRTVAQLEEMEREARDEGFARGHAEGLEAGMAEVRDRAARLDALCEALHAPLAELDDRVEQELCELTFAVARQVVRRELKTAPEEVIGAARAALGALPAACRNVRVELHPDDAELVRQALAPADGAARWRIVEDPLLTRGGCRVLSDTSRIDARVQTRLGAAINQVLGSDRDDDEPEAGDE